MRVLFDHQIFCNQKYGGISRYVCELITTLSQNRKITITLPLIASDNVYVNKLNVPGVTLRYKNHALPNLDSWLGGLDFKGKGIFYRFARKRLGLIGIEDAQKLALQHIRANDYDIFHPTYYAPYFLKDIQRPYVVTVHDMIHERFPEYFPHDHTHEHKQKVVREATAIIAISEATKRDLMFYLQVPERKIHVIHHGTSLFVQQDASVVSALPDSYILYTGARAGYKNFSLFLAAVAEVMIKTNTCLVCTGPVLTTQEKQYIAALKLDKLVRHYFVGDAQLACLYNKAKLFVFPSLYEGFGIPILEAFSCGCPVALSNASCFPEIAGDAAIYFDPYDKYSIEQAVSRLLMDPGLCQKMIQRGKERACSFDWRITAEKTLAVYKSII